MGVVVLLHLGVLFPSSAGIMRQDQMLVVVFRLRILDPKIPGSDFAIWKTGVLLDAWRVAPSPSNIEDAGGRLAVAFPFQGGPTGILVNADPPDESVASQAHFERAFDLGPLVPSDFVEGEGGV